MTNGIKDLITENNENFPVGSFLIPRDCRKHVYAFYLFARRADDIADNSSLSSEEKVKSLTVIQNSLANDPEKLPEWAIPYNNSLKQTGCSPINGTDLLSAFIQDAIKHRYASWDELMDYCSKSAASVGRAMLDIHNEKDADFEGIDALCNALQVLNHIQDCKNDYLNHNRVYIPEDWLKAEGCKVEKLGEEFISQELRKVIDRCLIKTDELLAKANKSPNSIKRRGLRLETAVILRLAKALSYKLRRNDPLRNKIKLSKFSWVWCGAKGVVSSW
ncbi:MAG: squalene synthase HpnC [Rhodospirillaceae bacterium]|nr:squalene synthase HpnC [Rhodospirillaceae bacterium]|tara:strand:- start:10449 stop:11273 length:825 start_codon:yes stop_codon:yes gene_type:complete